MRGVLFDAEEGGPFQCRPGVPLNADPGVPKNAEGGSLSLRSDESFMRVEKQYVWNAEAVVPHPYPDPEDDSNPTVTGAWLELSDPFTLEDATYEVTQKEDDQSVSQVTIMRVTTERDEAEGVPEEKASVTCDFEIVTTHHTPPIRYVTLADCEGDANVYVSTEDTPPVDAVAFALLAEGVLNKDSSRPVKLSTPGLSYNPRSYSYRFRRYK